MEFLVGMTTPNCRMKKNRRPYFLRQPFLPAAKINARFQPALPEKYPR
jgi:hypothetical protein